MLKINYKGVDVVFRRDFMELMRLKSSKISITLFIIFTVVTPIITNNMFEKNDWLQMPENSVILKSIIGNILFLLSMIPMIVSIPLFTSIPFTKEKANGTIDCLLSTKLKPNEIWLGKSLAVFLPGFITATISALFIICAFDNMVSIPLPLFLSVFLITPIFIFGLTVFTIQLSMIKTPEMAVAPSYLVGLALLVGVPISSIINIAHIASWKFMLIYFEVALLMWIFVLIFSFLLTKERIMLSK